MTLAVRFDFNNLKRYLARCRFGEDPSMTILGVDVGTTGMKMGIFREEEKDLTMLAGFS